MTDMDPRYKTARWKKLRLVVFARERQFDDAIEHGRIPESEALDVEVPGRDQVMTIEEATFIVLAAGGEVRVRDEESIDGMELTIYELGNETVYRVAAKRSPEVMN